MSVSGPYVFGHRVRAWQGVPSCTTAVLRSLHSLGLWDLELGCSVILAGCPHTVPTAPFRCLQGFNVGIEAGGAV